jgi:hypothetical protein
MFASYVADMCPGLGIAPPKTTLSELQGLFTHPQEDMPRATSGDTLVGKPHNLKALINRVEALESQQHQLIETIRTMERTVNNSSHIVEKLSHSMVDAFYEIQQILGNKSLSRNSSLYLPEPRMDSLTKSTVATSPIMFPIDNQFSQQDLDDSSGMDSKSIQQHLQMSTQLNSTPISDAVSETDDLKQVQRTFLDGSSTHLTEVASCDNSYPRQITSLDTLVEDTHSIVFPMEQDPETGTISTSGRNRLDDLRDELASRLPEIVLESCKTRADLLRQSSIYELIQTERDFVRDLSVLCEVVQPLAEEKGIVEQPEIFFQYVSKLKRDHQCILEILDTKVSNCPVIEGFGKVLHDMVLTNCIKVENTNFIVL